MAKAISLREVIDGIEGIFEGAEGYLHRSTGEVFVAGEEDLSAADAGEESDARLPAWQVEDVKKLRTILESEEWIPLPTMFDFHEYEVMREFCESVEDEDLRADLLDSIRGSGAFRRFKNKVERAGRVDDWYAYRDRALKKFAQEWLEEQGLEYWE
ncbi:MAG TPA: UPF0158 family protein [Phycisphaerae bacterium]|nr:UPF0158 family protein [Phycisphaerae bacterium]